MDVREPVPAVPGPRHLSPPGPCSQSPGVLHLLSQGPKRSQGSAGAGDRSVGAGNSGFLSGLGTNRVRTICSLTSHQALCVLLKVQSEHPAA